MVSDVVEDAWAMRRRCVSCRTAQQLAAGYFDVPILASQCLSFGPIMPPVVVTVQHLPPLPSLHPFDLNTIIPLYVNANAANRYFFWKVSRQKREFMFISVDPFPSILSKYV